VDASKAWTSMDKVRYVDMDMDISLDTDMNMDRKVDSDLGLFGLVLGHGLWLGIIHGFGHGL
jgi:hypothetical protein